MVSAFSATTLGIEVGDVVGEKYRIESVLGAGGMGVVFSARHTMLNGQFALKFLSREGLTSPQAISRFQREAQAAARLRSEHAVRVFDVGTHTNGLPYIVMESLDGGDLGRLLRASGQLPVPEAVDYILQTCAAIAEAHKAGIIHRDLKPSNLFCLPREDKSILIKVLDFGISKVTSGHPSEEAVTVTGNFIGSPSYMSPEQMRAPNRVDLRTDIWSLGVVLYECLTGKLPFPAGTFPEVCLRVAQEPPILPTSYRPDLPRRLEAIILRCLEKDRERRFGSIKELSDALSEFANAPPPRLASSYLVASMNVDIAPGSARQPTKTASFGFPQHSWARTASAVRSRHKPLLLGLFGGALALVAVLVGALIYGRQQLRADVSASVAASSGMGALSASSDVPPPPSAAAASTPPAAPAPSAQAPVTESPRFESAPGREEVQVLPVPPASTFAASQGPAPGPGGARSPQNTAPTQGAPSQAGSTARGLGTVDGAAPAQLPNSKKPALLAPSKPSPERDAKSSTWKR